MRLGKLIYFGGLVSCLSGCSAKSDAPVVYPEPEGKPIGRWSSLPPLDGNRYLSAKVLAGNEYVSWGSNDSMEGDILNLETGEWRMMSEEGAPPPRDGASAFWTGEEVLIWGGCLGAGFTPATDGGLYDPTVDSWRATSLTGAPSPRRHVTAEWTGEEMLVWGGADDLCGTSAPVQGFPRDGAAYNPATNSWRPISSTGEPSGRAGTSHVWTGKEMLVWGGTTGVDPELSNGDGRVEDRGRLGDGAAYNPKTDAWRPISAEGAPPANWGAFSAWTGAEMLLWDDNSLDGGQVTMAAYNPKTDSWRDINPAGPHLRYWSCSVWTGKYFVVCGDGSDPEGGAAYDPVKDIWHPIPASPNPYASGLEGFAYQGDLVAFGGWDHYIFYGDTIGYRLYLSE